MAEITRPVQGTGFTNGIVVGRAQTGNNSITISNSNVGDVAYNARWQWSLVNAEAGSNTGCDLQLVAVADDGTTIIATAIFIDRDTGNVTLHGGGGALNYVNLGLTGAYDLNGYNDISYVDLRGNAITSFSGTNMNALQGLRLGDDPITALTLSSATGLTSLDLSGNTLLVDLSLVNLGLTSLNLATNTLLETLTLSYCPITSLNLSNNTALTDITLSSDTSLASIDVTGLTAVTDFALSSADAMTSFDASPMTALTSLTIQNSPNVTSVTITNPLVTLVYIYGCALDQASVDGILAQLVTNGEINGQVDLSAGTSSPPSAAGLVSKTTLEGDGWTVTVNS